MISIETGPQETWVQWVSRVWIAALASPIVFIVEEIIHAEKKNIFYSSSDLSGNSFDFLLLDNARNYHLTLYGGIIAGSLWPETYIVYYLKENIK